MDDRAWTEGMLKLVAAFPDRDITPEAFRARGDIYRERLDDLTDAQWLRAVSVCLDLERFFPAIATLRGYAHVDDGDGLLLTEGQAFLERVLNGLGASYLPQAGTTWNLRKIVEGTNPAFGEALGAGGGVGALANCDPDIGVPIRDRKILETYVAVARQSPQLRKPEERPELTQGEAKNALEQIKGAERGARLREMRGE